MHDTSVLGAPVMRPLGSLRSLRHQTVRQALAAAQGHAAQQKDEDEHDSDDDEAHPPKRLGGRQLGAVDERMLSATVQRAANGRGERCDTGKPEDPTEERRKCQRRSCCFWIVSSTRAARSPPPPPVTCEI